MGNPEVVRRYSIAEYLAMEEAADCRSEYFEGEIFAMAGGTADHDRIASDCDRFIGDAIAPQGCETFTSNMKVRIAGGNAYYYPDLSIVCGKATFEDEKRTILTNPVLIIEVLSESTESFDRGMKFRRYRQISSLREYVLIAQTEPYVDVFYKNDDGGWALRTYIGLEAAMPLQSLGIEVRLSDIYRRVEFPAEPQP